MVRKSAVSGCCSRTVRMKPTLDPPTGATSTPASNSAAGCGTALWRCEQGTAFVMVAPADRHSPAAPAPKLPVDGYRPIGTRMSAPQAKLLIVDDEELNRDGLARRLQRHDYEVAVANS